MRWFQKAAIAAAFVLAYVIPALALDTSTGSALDLAPLLNPLIQAAGAIVAAALSALAIMAINWLRQKMKLEKVVIDAAMQAKIDSAAQTAIGGAIARIQIPEGKHVLDFKHKIIADAAQKLAAGFGETLRDVGSKDNVKKAQEIVENRLGLMTAEAKGTPVPNPSKPVAVAPAQATPAPTTPATK